MCAGVIICPSTCKLQHLKKYASTTEVKPGVFFLKGRDVIILHNTLEEMGQPQPITQVCTENKKASGIANDTINQQLSCAINMRYFWIQDEKTFKNFLLHGKQDNKTLQPILQNVILKTS